MEKTLSFRSLINLPVSICTSYTAETVHLLGMSSSIVIRLVVTGLAFIGQHYLTGFLS
jgi:hypothetical protein